MITYNAELLDSMLNTVLPVSDVSNIVRGYKSPFQRLGQFTLYHTSHNTHMFADVFREKNRENVFTFHTEYRGSEHQNSDKIVINMLNASKHNQLRVEKTWIANVERSYDNRTEGACTQRISSHNTVIVSNKSRVYSVDLETNQLTNMLIQTSNHGITMNEHDPNILYSIDCDTLEMIDLRTKVLHSVNVTGHAIPTHAVPVAVCAGFSPYSIIVAIYSLTSDPKLKLYDIDSRYLNNVIDIQQPSVEIQYDRLIITKDYVDRTLLELFTYSYSNEFGVCRVPITATDTIHQLDLPISDIQDSMKIETLINISDGRILTAGSFSDHTGIGLNIYG